MNVHESAGAVKTGHLESPVVSVYPVAALMLILRCLIETICESAINPPSNPLAYVFRSFPH